VRRYERAVGEVFGEGKNRRRGCGFGFGFGEGKFDLLWRELLGKILVREKIAQLLLSRIEATRLPGERGNQRRGCDVAGSTYLPWSLDSPSVRLTNEEGGSIY